MNEHRNEFRGDVPFLLKSTISAQQRSVHLPVKHMKLLIFFLLIASRSQWKNPIKHFIRQSKLVFIQAFCKLSKYIRHNSFHQHISYYNPKWFGVIKRSFGEICTCSTLNSLHTFVQKLHTISSWMVSNSIKSFILVSLKWTTNFVCSSEMGLCSVDKSQPCQISNLVPIFRNE